MKNKYSEKQRMTLLVAMVTSFVTTFNGSALNLSIPDMGAELQVSAAAIGWMVTAYTLAVAALSVPFGRIADLSDRKKILVSGICLFSLCSLLSAFAGGIAALVALRIVQGFGGAMIFATNTAMLVDAFPGEDRGKVLGYAVSCTYIGLSAGPVLGGMFNHYFGWRSIFLLTFAVSFSVFLIALKKLPAVSGHGEKGGFDKLGAFLCMAMIVAVLYGLSAVSTSRYAVGIIILGVLLFIWFIRQELKSPSPVIDVRLFMTNQGYAFSNLAALLNYGATFAISYLMSIYLQVVMGYSSQAAGLILIVQPVIMAALSPQAGRLSDRISPFKLSSFGMGLCAVGLLLFAFVSQNTSLWFIIAALVISGVGFAFFSSPNNNAVMASVEKTDYGVASSLLATMRTIGQSGSMAVLTVIVGLYMDGTVLTDADPEVLIHTMNTGFLVFTVICAAGVFVSLRRK